MSLVLDVVISGGLRLLMLKATSGSLCHVLSREHADVESKEKTKVPCVSDCFWLLSPRTLDALPLAGFHSEPLDFESFQLLATKRVL